MGHPAAPPFLAACHGNRVSGQNNAVLIRQIVSMKTESRPDHRKETGQMKTRRWMKSVIATAQSPGMAAAPLPWQRGPFRAAMTAKRRLTFKITLRA